MQRGFVANHRQSQAVLTSLLKVYLCGHECLCHPSRNSQPMPMVRVRRTCNCEEGRLDNAGEQQMLVSRVPRRTAQRKFRAHLPATGNKLDRGARGSPDRGNIRAQSSPRPLQVSTAYPWPTRLNGWGEKNCLRGNNRYPLESKRSILISETPVWLLSSFPFRTSNSAQTTHERTPM